MRVNMFGRTMGRSELGRGMVLCGTVWCGGDSLPTPGVVIVDGAGVIRFIGPKVPADTSVTLPRFGAAESWIGPGIIDTNVIEEQMGSAPAADGVLKRRILGDTVTNSPHRIGFPSRRQPSLRIHSGPMLAARSGQGKYLAVPTPAAARPAIKRLQEYGAALVMLNLEPVGATASVPDSAVIKAVVRASHQVGLPVGATAQSLLLVQRGVAAGVDEFVNVPRERLDNETISQLADAGIGVCSALQTSFSAGTGRDAAANAAALFQAGVALRYGTGAVTNHGVDPRELDRLADAGLGRFGALVAATSVAASAVGVSGCSGLLRVGEPAELVVLAGDPLREPELWCAPKLVLVAGKIKIY